VGRFLLLIATAFAGAAYIFGWLTERLAAVSTAPARCARLAQQAQGRILPDALVDWYGRCTGWASLFQAGLIVAALAVLVVATFGTYIAWPWRMVRGRLPFGHPAVRDLPAARAIEHLVHVEQGMPRVRLWFDPSNGPASTQAFGHFGRYQVSVGSGLLMDPSGKMRGTLLHELAHIRSRDVDLTYLSQALWPAYLLFVVVPLAAVAIDAPALLAGFLVRIAVLLALLWSVRVSVLRIREFHADAAAATTPSDERAVLESLESGTKPVSWWTSLYHPSHGARRKAVRDRRPLFRFHAGVAAVTGLLAGIAYTPAYFLSSLVLPGGVYERGWACGLLFGLLIGAVLTGSTWRAALWSIAEDGPPPRTLSAAIAFSAGLLAGQLLTPDLLATGTWGMVVRASPLVGAVIAVVVPLACQAFLRWTVWCARAWLRVTGRPRRAYHFAVAQSSVVIGLWLAAWFQVVELASANGGLRAVGIAAVATIVNPLLVLSLAWMALYPAIPGSVLPAAYAVAAGVVALYGMVMLPWYGNLRAAVATADLIEVARILLIPGLGTAALGMLVLGYLLGGHTFMARAVSGAAVSLLLCSAGLFVVALTHLTLASPTVRDLPTLLSGLSGYDLGGGPTGDAPPPSLGLMLVAWYAILAAAGVPAAVLGSLVRLLCNRNRPRSSVPACSGLAAYAYAWSVPVVVLGVVTGWLAWTEWRVPETLAVTASVDQAAVQPIINSARVGSMSYQGACHAIRAALDSGAVAADTTSNELPLRMARIAALAMSSDDATLRAMGESTADALSLSEIRRAGQGVAVSLQYCAASGAIS